MTLHPIPSEFPYIWEKFWFLFFQCRSNSIKISRTWYSNIFYLGIFLKIPDCFGLFRNSSVCFGCFDKGSKHRNKPKIFFVGFTKQTETNAKQILFRFVSVPTEIFFCSFRGHPTFTGTYLLVKSGSAVSLKRRPQQRAKPQYTVHDHHGTDSSLPFPKAPPPLG